MESVGKKKRGRPTISPKNYRLSVRIDSEAKKALDSYCKKNDASVSEAVQKAAMSLTELKKDI